jgi:hypothetical protein
MEFLPQTLVAVLIGGGIGALYAWRKRRSQQSEPREDER